MEILEYIKEEALVVAPALWVIGAFLKLTPKMPDWLIPWTLLVLGVTATVLMMGQTVEAVIQGVLVTGFAVLAHQLVKQTTRKE